MTRRIEFVAEIPDDADVSVEMMGRFAFTIRADGIESDAVPAILLAGVEALSRQQIRQDLEDESPLGNPDFMDTVAALEARIMLVDMAVHLPDADQIGIVTQV